MLLQVYKSFYKNFHLIYELSKREILAGYKGTFLGIAWSVVNPIFMLTIYTFFFSTVFKSRWEGFDSSIGSSSVILFSGIIIHSFFSESINRAPHLIVGNINFVKKMVFPLEILPFIPIMRGVFHLCISVILLLCAQMLFHGTLQYTAIFMPFILLPLILYSLAFSWILSVLGVYLRDMAHLVQTLTVILLFISPVFYPVSAVPESIKTILYLNPLTSLIEQFRDVLIFGRQPEYLELSLHYALSMILASFGLYFFQHIRKGFADVL